jgi:hypothetical protein
MRKGSSTDRKGTSCGLHVTGDPHTSLRLTESVGCSIEGKPLGQGVEFGLDLVLACAVLQMVFGSKLEGDPEPQSQSGVTVVSGIV